MNRIMSILLRMKFLKINQLLLLGLATVFMIDPLHALPKAVAFVLKVSGDAQYRLGTGGSWKQLKPAVCLKSGDQIKTGMTGLVSIVFTDDKSLMKIRASSELTIKSKRKEQSFSKRIIARFGELWFKIKGNENDFVLETPSGIAAVKGTEFYAIIDQQGNTTIIGIQGIIELISKIGKAVVKSGNTGVLSPRGEPLVNETNPDQIPTWGTDSEDGNSLEIEFQDKKGNKKRLKIIFKS